MNFLKRNIILSVIAALMCSVTVVAQDSDTTLLDWRRGLFPKTKDGELYQIKASGFYRFFATNLYMPEPYIIDQASNSVTKKRTLFIGDDTQLPNFLVNVSGRPNKKVSWGFDIFMFQFLDGMIGPTYTGQVPTNQRPPVWDPLTGTRLGASMGLNLGLNLYGSYITSKGTYNVRVGGIHWFSISDLTLGSFRGYNRFMLYERNPWDPIGKQVGVRYNQMYELGAVYQDQRWGERAVQGAIFEGINLPNGWSFAAMYGKTELAGGFMTIPNINYGGKLRKTFRNSSFVSFNTLNNTSWIDSTNTTAVGFNVFTLEYGGSYKGFNLSAEVGTGRYVTPFEGVVSPSGEIIDAYPWGEAISVKLLATERVLRFPLEIHYYRISPYVVNNNAVFWNTSIIESALIDRPGAEGVQSANVLTPFSSSVVALGQMTNNRTGVNLNTEIKLGDLKLSAGYGVSQEIEGVRDPITGGPIRMTFTHFTNQFTRARFWRWNFPVNVGPYGRYDKVYRDAYQKVNVTEFDVNGPINPKKFTNLELHGKYRTKLGYRNFYAFFLGRYNTVQPEFSILPKWNEQAYLRQYNSEVEFYYQISKPVFLNSYFGYERVLGNYQTEVDSETFRPLNQTGWGVGVGIDVSIGRNAGLYLRHRWFFFEDTSFGLDKFRGQETMAELKVFF